jgi:hypothetical protein
MRKRALNTVVALILFGMAGLFLFFPEATPAASVMQSLHAYDPYLPADRVGYVLAVVGFITFGWGWRGMVLD